MANTSSNQSVTFTQDALLVAELIALLEREQSHLVKADVEAIEAILEEKSLLLQRLNLAAKSRYQLLQAHGFQANESGMSDWVEKQAKKDITTAWVNFQKSLEQAKELNRLNGTLISKHFNRNQELLNHLQGNNDSSSVYGPDGQSKTTPPTRTGLAV
ncbi:MAG: flagellar protein FlgN [Methylotenera sp.]|nr:flagellar protein FlgN [Methylotenera sp.]